MSQVERNSKSDEDFVREKFASWWISGRLAPISTCHSCDSCEYQEQDVFLNFKSRNRGFDDLSHARYLQLKQDLSCCQALFSNENEAKENNAIMTMKFNVFTVSRVIIYKLSNLIGAILEWTFQVVPR
ncbi:hypothetical protein Zmor_002694 [Zophobas morio]|uniref:Uncharacterized protein n=1 Tax=Zophobas morio TaxID=2755281 RepID=A0AA38HK29_9CUCU|nr:hypothetical protein Zmor_002694 [Zophobas morio]